MLFPLYLIIELTLFASIFVHITDVQKMNSKEMKKRENKKPEWLKITASFGKDYRRVDSLIRDLKLNTVCHSANCPNRGECYTRGTATFLIMGSICTRGCRFCDIATGKPNRLDLDEPKRVADAAKILGLKHVVVTSVDRDDLSDGGANHFVRTIEEIREVLPKTTIEILTPDFRNVPEAPQIIIASKPDVFNHNVETVPRLYKTARPGASYERSLNLLKAIKDNSDIITKSGLMVGLGETKDELLATLEDLREHDVEMLTIGQYLQPSKEHLPVARYVHPDEFEEYQDYAYGLGFQHVASGPLVRSSYHADKQARGEAVS